MQVKMHRDRGITVISMHGKLDGSAAWQIRNELDYMLDIFGKSKLWLDFSLVRRWERFGVVLLAETLKSLRAHFGEIQLIGMADTLAELFGSVGLKNNIPALARIPRNIR